MTEHKNTDSCLLNKHRLELEEACTKLILTHSNMRGTIANQISDMPTKGLVLSTNRGRGNSFSAEAKPSLGNGTSVDDPLPHHEIISQMVKEVEEDLPAVKYIPRSLSLDMCQRAPRLQQEDMDVFYDVQESSRHVETGEISHVQLVILYLRSFRNTLEYDFRDMQELKERFAIYFGNILADVLELCYPHIQDATKMEMNLLDDLRRNSSQRNPPPES